MTQTGPDLTRICQAAQLPPEAMSLLQPEMNTGTLIDALCASGQYPAAIQLLAQALSPHNAVAWACASRRALPGPDERAEAMAALEAAETWLVAPTDENRRAAKNTADAAPPGPESCAAMAVFFAGGSVAPPEAPAVAPEPWICQRIAAGAVLLAIVSFEPENAAERFSVALDLGRKAATGSLGALR